MKASYMTHKPVQASRHHQGGVAAIIAMMFVVIFGSLATAMAIVAQGNLATADTHIKVNRALAASETGMHFLIYRMRQTVANVQTSDGLINADNAPALWNQTRAALLADFQNDLHNIEEPYEVGTTLRIGPIAVGPNSPALTATLTPHPLAGEDYDSPFYQRPPYSQMDPPVSAAAPLDVTWIRVRVEAADGGEGHAVTRSITMDFKIDKKIRFAVLSKSRVMIGRNVMIEGQIGSRFLETYLTHGHPVQMRSDFHGLDPQLDADIEALTGTLILNDTDGDNRINLEDDAEIDGMSNPHGLDTNADGYIDEYDFFAAHFDSNGDGAVTGLELGADTSIEAAQLLELIDTFGDPSRPGYGDGVINNDDDYSKIRGQVMILADMQGWNEGAAGGAYQDYFAGPIHPDHGESPLTFEADEAGVHQFDPEDFDVSSFEAMATGSLETQSQQQAALHDPADPSSPQPLGQIAREAVPYGAAYPYDYYDRPVLENMTFNDVTIPQGTNALFINCTFIGTTFVETTTSNDDPNFNLVGIEEADGTLKHPGLTAMVQGQEITNTKTKSNNIRFHSCTFEGSVITDSPPAFTHTRNKIAFTGTTQFEIESSTNLTQEQKDLFSRSTILAPHYSVEMGSFDSPADTGEAVKLSGTIVAGVLDMRGQVDINGTILTTFEPVSGVAPVMGQTSSHFNTTIGYFPSAAGDMEAELPAGGVGVIKLRYNPDLPLPDGILGPIEIEPVVSTYFEGGTAN